MLRIIILQFFFGGLALSANSQKIINSSVTLIPKNGQFTDKNSFIHLYYTDSIRGHSTLLQNESLKLPITSPTFIINSNDHDEVPYYVYPYEKINISYSENKNDLDFTINGNIERNNELLFFKQLVRKTGFLISGSIFKRNIFQKKAQNKNEFKELQKQLQILKKTRIAFTTDYFNRNKVSNKFKILSNDVINYSFIHDNAILNWVNRKLLKQVGIFDREMDSCISLLKKQKFVSNYICCSALRNTVEITTGIIPIYKSISNNKEFIKAFDYSIKNFEGEQKDYLISTFLYAAAALDGYDIPDSVIQIFNKECIDENFKHLVAERLNEKKDENYYPTKGNNLLKMDENIPVDIQTILSNGSGNVILLDFWASWCSPCREEMPNSKKLKERYKGKPISFVYISIDESKNDWHKANDEEKLDSQSSYLFLNSNNAPFIKQFKIYAIPRYMLIGKDGKIINSDAPRPSDPKLKELIDKYLK